MKRIKKNKLVHVLSIISVFALFTATFLPFNNKIFPNISVGGIYLGEKSKNDAVIYFKNKYKIQPEFTININGTKNKILSSEIITSIDAEKSIDRAYYYTNSGNIISDLLSRIKLIFKPINFYPAITIDEKKLLETLLILTDKAGSKPEFPSAKKVNGEIVVHPGKDGIVIDLQKTRSEILNTILDLKNSEINISLKEVKTKLSENDLEKYRNAAKSLIGKKIILKLDHDTIEITDDELISFLTPDGYSDEKIKNKILDISRQLNRNPQDSVFIVENEKVKEFIPSKDGITVEETKLLKLIKELPNEIEIPVVKISPDIKTEDINNLGINSLIGTGNSNFKGSIPNRIHNVNLAQSKFKGVLIPPNEIVSFNQILGDVSAYTGYKSAYVIMDGKTVLGDGGGVCQVSTTLFRAVLSAGLPIIERRAHAYRVGYYEQGFGPGLDATVYSPTTDFKFKNDTPAYILIQPTIDLENLALKFEIYGTNDGRVSSVTKPIITSSIAPAEDQYIDDPTLPIGTLKQIEHRAYGAKVIFDYKVTKNGEELINQKFISNYRPWRAVYLRGTAQ